MLEKGLTLTQAATRVRCSEATLSRAIKRGRLTAYRPGKLIIILQEDLIKWLQSKKITPQKRQGAPRKTVTAHPGVSV